MPGSRALVLESFPELADLSFLVRAAPGPCLQGSAVSCRGESSTQSLGVCDVELPSTHRPLSSSLLGLPYRTLNIIQKTNYLGAYG